LDQGWKTFTLIELLVATGFLAILTSILPAALQKIIQKTERIRANAL